MSNVLADFLFKVALMIAGYFFVCAAISYAIEHYFKVKNGSVEGERDGCDG